MSQNWTWEDYDTLRKEYPRLGNDIVNVIPNRSLATIKNKAEKLHTYNYPIVSAEERKLVDTYGNALGTAMIFLLPSRTVYEIEEMLK
jgi:hypothetical protein